MKCSNCNEDVPMEGKICPFCHAQIVREREREIQHKNEMVELEYTVNNGFKASDVLSLIKISFFGLALLGIVFLMLMHINARTVVIILAVMSSLVALVPILSFLISKRIKTK